MKILDLLQKSVAFNIVNVISKGLTLLIFIYASSKITVSDLGIYGEVSLVAQYLFLFSAIFTSAAVRELPIHDETNRKLSDSKLSWSIFIDLALFSISILICFYFYFSYMDQPFGYLYLYLAIFILFQKLHQIWSSITLTRKEFDLLLQSRLWQIAFFLIGFFMLAIFDILLALILYPFLGYLGAWVFLNSKKVFNHNKNSKDLGKKNIIRAGLSLQLLTVCFWGFRLSDKTAVALLFSTEALGIYTFISTIILFSRLAVGEFHNLLQPFVWKNIHEKNNEDRSLERISLLTGLAGLFVVYIVQLVFYFLSKFISIQYFEYTNVFNTLSYSLFFISISGICGMILNSKTYSKISISIIFSLFGFFVNLIGIYIVMKHDLGLNGIAFSMVISVFMSTFPLFIFCKQALFKQRGDLMKLFILWFVPVFILMYLQVFFFRDVMGFSLIALIILTVSSLIKRREIYNLVK